MARKAKAEFRSNGHCLCYLRVSTGDQVKSGRGLQSQADICAAKARELGLKFVDEQYDHIKPRRPGHFVDAGESAFRTPFAKRAAGGRVLQLAKPGDTVLVARLDRLCRNVEDFIQISAMLITSGIRLVVCSPSIDLGTATGRMLARQLANMAEWESDRRSERICAALAAKRQRDGVAKAAKAIQTVNLPSEWRPVSKATPDTPNEAGRIFLYIRCSHRDSVESGLGMINQMDAARACAARIAEDNPLTEISSLFTDPAVSGYSKPLRERPAGKQLDAALQRGDHVVFASLDRGFRNVKDLVNTIPEWLQRGVHIHFANEALSMDDATGQSIATIIGVFAQLEAELAADRNRETRAQNAIKGKYVGGREPTFWVVYRTGRTKKLEIDRRKIAQFRLIGLFQRQGCTFKEACAKVEVLVAKRENRPVLPASGVHRFSKYTPLLPKDYPFDRNGLAYPAWNYDKYQKARKHFAKAMEDWRTKAAVLKRLRHCEQDEESNDGKNFKRGIETSDGARTGEGTTVLEASRTAVDLAQ